MVEAAIILILLFFGLMFWFVPRWSRPKYKFQPTDEKILRRVHKSFDFLMYKIKEDYPSVGHPGIPLDLIARTAKVTKDEALAGMLEMTRHIPPKQGCPGRPPQAHCLHGNWYSGERK